MIGDNGKNKLFNYRPLFELALGLMAGILLCSELPSGFRIISAALIVFAGAVLYIFKLRRFANFFLAALFGFALSAISLPYEYSEGNARISGTVTDIDEKNGAAVLTLEQVTLNDTSFNEKARLTVDDPQACSNIKIGDIVEADAKLRAAQRRFGTYDEAKSLLSRGIGCIAEAKSAAVIAKHKLPMREYIISIRSAVEARINSVFADDSGLFNALLLGVRDELDDERAEAYRASGTAHLLAISGFHMGILVGAVSLMIPKRKRILHLAAVCVFAVAYCTVASYTPGIVRAGIMTICILTANTLQRRADTLSALSLASILILVFNPFQLYSIGFRLSFSAVFGIGLLSNSFTRHLSKLKLPLKLCQAAAVCLGATAGTLMLQLRCYSSFSPYSVFANLIAVPAFSAVVILGALSVLIAFISPAAAAVFAIAPRSILFVVERLLALFSKLPLASLEFAPPSPASCMIYLLLLFAVSEYVLRKKRTRLEYAVPLLILFTFSYFMGIIKA